MLAASPGEESQITAEGMGKGNSAVPWSMSRLIAAYPLYWEEVFGAEKHRGGAQSMQSDDGSPWAASAVVKCSTGA